MISPYLQSRLSPMHMYSSSPWHPKCTIRLGDLRHQPIFSWYLVPNLKINPWNILEHLGTSWNILELVKMMAKCTPPKSTKTLQKPNSFFVSHLPGHGGPWAVSFRSPQLAPVSCFVAAATEQGDRWTAAADIINHGEPQDKNSDVFVETCYYIYVYMLWNDIKNDQTWKQRFGRTFDILEYDLADDDGCGSCTVQHSDLHFSFSRMSLFISMTRTSNLKPFDQIQLHCVLHRLHPGRLQLGAPLHHQQRGAWDGEPPSVQYQATRSELAKTWGGYDW